MLGICYGMQAMVLELGGRVEGAEAGEFGRTALTLAGDGGRLLAGLPAEQQCWMSHRDSVFEAPPGVRRRSPPAPARRSPRSRTPSAASTGSSSTPRSSTRPTASRSSTASCARSPAARRSWSPASVIDEQVERIRAQVGDAGVICGLSGGVDSATAAALVHRAVGDQLTCVLVDHGLMRLNEADQVVTAMEELGVNLILVDAEAALPRPARRGRRARAQAHDHRRGVHPRVRGRGGEARRGRLPGPGNALLGRDRVRRRRPRPRTRSSPTTTSAASPRTSASTSSSRCGCCSRTRSARSPPSSGSPSASSGASRSPGPGLAIRIVGGEVNRERLDILRDADAILQEEIKAASLYRELWQSFCVLPVVRSVGVQGDGRTYAYPIVIRAVTSQDAMTADWARLPYDLLERVSNRIINEVAQVNRVALDISSKPPATIEWE